MIFYGWGRKRKVLKNLGFIECEGCNGQERTHHLVVDYTYISLFFIPVIRWGKKYFIICGNCGKIKEISKKEAKEYRK